MQTYPFLVGKSEKFHDWSCIAQPEFLRAFEGPAGRVLEEAQAGIKFASNEIRLVRCTDPEHGVLDVAYRRVPSGYLEKGGRPFDFIEGIVLRDRDPSLTFCSKHFDAARAAVQPQYEKFIKAESWLGHESWHSATIEVETLPYEPPLKVLEANSERLPPVADEKTQSRPSSDISSVDNAGRKLIDFDSSKYIGQKTGRLAPSGFLEQKMAELNARKAAGSSSENPASQTSYTEPLNDQTPPATPQGHAEALKLLVILAATGGALILVAAFICLARKKH
jgi:hypothetical protein